MRAVWSELVDKCPHLVEELYEHAEPTPAMLTMLAAEWRVAEDPVEDVAAFAGEFMRQKLRLEVRKWRAWEAEQLALLLLMPEQGSHCALLLSYQ